MSTNEIPATTEITNQTTANGRDVYPPSAAPEATRARSTEETTTDEGGRDAHPTIPLSPNKVAANRRNALKSTGPLTLRGKEAARMNAVRHGILSSAVVVRGVRIREHEDEFKALRDQCWECLGPVGRMEEALVDKIVTAQWRMRRALIAETGEIAKSVDGGLRVRGNVALKMYGTLVDPIRDSSFALEESSEGLDFLEGILRRVREGMARDGVLTQEMCEWVEKRFGSANVMTRTLWEYWTKFLTDMKAVKKEEKAAPASTGVAAGESAEASASALRATADEVAGRMAEAIEVQPTEVAANDSGVSSDSAYASATEAPFDDEFGVDEIKLRHQTAVERYIELKLMDYAELRRKCREREDKKETAAQAADVLPSSDVLEKIMRYEAALERQMYRAMNQLERLQRRRGGEKLAAPLMMDVMK